MAMALQEPPCLVPETELACLALVPTTIFMASLLLIRTQYCLVLSTV